MVGASGRRKKLNKVTGSIDQEANGKKKKSCPVYLPLNLPQAGEAALRCGKKVNPSLPAPQRKRN